MKPIRLGVNIDHIATLRNARGSESPDPVRAIEIIAAAGADGITAHLREDRRHIRDKDLFRIKDTARLPLNMEMAATDEMLAIALKVKPNAACIVPERREEITTEGGLDVLGNKKKLKKIIPALQDQGIRVSLFIEPSLRHIEAAQEVGADIVELHTGSYCHHTDDRRAQKLLRLQEAAAYTAEAGLECHAGHGLNYDNVAPVAAIAEVMELNIGHFLMGEALFVGIEVAVKQMRNIMNGARGGL